MVTNGSKHVAVVLTPNEARVVLDAIERALLPLGALPTKPRSKRERAVLECAVGKIAAASEVAEYTDDSARGEVRTLLAVVRSLEMGAAITRAQEAKQIAAEEAESAAKRGPL